jgi:hypothetical protein
VHEQIILSAFLIMYPFIQTAMMQLLESLYLCVLYVSVNKHRLFRYTALTDLFL